MNMTDKLVQSVRTAERVEVKRPKFEGGHAIVYRGLNEWVLAGMGLRHYPTVESAQLRADVLSGNNRIFHLPADDKPTPQGQDHWTPPPAMSRAWLSILIRKGWRESDHAVKLGTSTVGAICDAIFEGTKELITHDLTTEVARLERKLDDTKVPGDRLVHGANCIKAVHDDMHVGYLHGAADDCPYNVDGIPYCGRCHCFLSEQLPVAMPEELREALPGILENLQDHFASKCSCSDVNFTCVQCVIRRAMVKLGIEET